MNCKKKVTNLHAREQLNEKIDHTSRFESKSKGSRLFSFFPVFQFFSNEKLCTFINFPQSFAQYMMKSEKYVPVVIYKHQSIGFILLENNINTLNI